MNTIRIAGALFVMIALAGTAEANWFRRAACACPPASGGGAGGTSERIPPPKPAAPPALGPLNISHSGLEAKIQKRIRDWGGAPIVPVADPPGQTVTVKIGDTTLEIRVTVVGKSGPPVIPTTDLAKTLQAAYQSDSQPAGPAKEHAKQALIKTYESLASQVRSNNRLMLGNMEVGTKEDLRRFVNAMLLNSVNPSHLKNTQDAIDAHVIKFLPKKDNTPLTPALRASVGNEFENIARALRDIK